MAEIQGNVVKKGKQSLVSGFLNAKGDKDAIAAWRQDLVKILHVFNVRSASSIWHPLTAFLQTELAINTHVMVAGIYQNVLANQEGAHLVSATSSPPVKQC